jgi:hypothetical protein
MCDLCNVRSFWPGKGVWRQSLLEHFYTISGEGQEEHVKGFKLTGQALDDENMLHLCDYLGAAEPGERVDTCTSTIYGRTG